jgi:hypothetical protein
LIQTMKNDAASKTPPHKMAQKSSELLIPRGGGCSCSGASISRDAMLRQFYD